MVTKNQKKLIRSLNKKKYRKQHGLFVVEGVKGINEFLNTQFELAHLFVIPEFVDLFKNFDLAKVNEISEIELAELSFLTTPQKAIAIFKIPKPQETVKTEGLKLLLDDVKDPGNLGTIIRMCDWFGIEELICSTETVDCYNPKVVQATMGSLTRVYVNYMSIENYIKEIDLPIFGAFIDGDNVYQTKLPEKGILIMGNEANGISKSIEKIITNRIAIPRFGKTQETESLNVATATAILLSEFKRNQ